MGLYDDSARQVSVHAVASALRAVLYGVVYVGRLLGPYAQVCLSIRVSEELDALRPDVVVCQDVVIHHVF